MKKIIVGMWLMLLLGAIGALFWYNEWVYQLPTPVPKNYKPVSRGHVIPLNQAVFKAGSKPLFIHFFNPDCPCSRFNADNFRSLVKKYSSEINFVVVVMSDKTFSVKQIQDKIDVNIPVLFDASIATACGVYSTPQAVLLDGQHRLYYRGNYNRSRYCADDKSDYAKMAINGLLHDNNRLVFSPLALKPYGCQLPGCTR